MKKWLVGFACVGLLATAAMGQEPAVWINEINYDSPGTDSNEFVEVAGPAGTSLADYALFLYNGTGGVVYGTNSLSGSIDDEGCGYGAVDFATAGIQNGPDAIALANIAGGVTTLVQFLSYEGSFLGVGGPADGQTSVAIGTQNTAATLQLGGTATNYSGYAWESNTMSQGSLNINQLITGCTPVVPTNVYFFAADAAVNEDQGTFDVIINKTLPEGEVSGEILLGGTATEGVDYTVSSTTFTLGGATTSTTVTVTIIDDADIEQDETAILTLNNVVNAGTVAPAVFTLTINPSDIPTHTITITPPTNGSVTTDPEGQAAEGATVTVVATPNGGFAVDVISVEDASSNPVAVSDNPPYTFVMPTSDVTVTVTFQEAATSGNLIISQYYEGASLNKWIEIYNPGTVAIDLAAGGYRLGQFSNAAREAWKTNGTPSLTVSLSGAIAAGGTYLVSHGSAVLPAYVTANQTAGWGFNGDDSVVLFTGETFDFANVVDAFGLLGETAVDKSYVRKDTITVGVNTDFNAADWDEFTNVQVDEAAEATNERLGYHSTGPAVFGVSLSQDDGYEVEQGSSGTITATASNGTEPYGYSWQTTMTEGDYTAVGAVFTILDTAALGDNYTATVTATDSSDPQQQAEKTVTFSVVAPPTYYSITINAPVNGSVTTDPEGQAAEGGTVTVNATPNFGYAVGTITVVGADETPIEVTGTGNARTFTMPAQAVTITVTFVEFTGSSLIISEVADPSGTGGDRGRFVELYNAGAETIDLAAGQWYLAKQVNGGATWDNIALTGTVGAAETYVVAAYADFLTLYPTAPAPDQISGNANGSGDDGYFLYSGGNNAAGVLQDSYGVINEDGSGMPWEYTDSRAVRNADVTAGNPTWTASEWTIASAVYADMTPGVHPDGPAVFSVLFTDQTEGFVVAEGAGATITASAVNGTPGYTYVWTTSMNPADYGTADGVFTINAAAPVGSYWAEVVATDSTLATASNRINFTIAAPYAITITPPVNGAVTTDPESQAIQGTTVTIIATPDANYAVGTIQVNGGAVSVSGSAPYTFTMPAEPVTVAVTFVLDIATLPIAENYTETMDWLTLVGWSGVAMSTYTDGSMAFNASGDQLMVHFDGEPGQLTFDVRGNTSTAGTAPMQFDVEESMDGVNWTTVDSIDDTEVSTSVTSLGPYALLSASRYVRWNYINKFAFNLALNNVAITSGGAPVFSVSVDKTNGFTVASGASDAIMATAENGTEPYGYSWTSTLGEGYRTAADNVFTILATAPAGDYTATVTATDSADPQQQDEETVSFTVLGGGGEVWTIGDGSQGSAMFYSTSNQNIVIVLPTNFMLDAVYGTDSSAEGLNNLGQGGLTPLTQDLDYTWTPATRTVSILSGVTNRRVLRIGASAP
ncbi:MAG: beta strand repeat-containing protein [Kiritimatiellia bacterium]